MSTTRWTAGLFILAAIYDGVLGLAFLAVSGRIFELSRIEPPNHVGYVQFPAALLLVFAFMFARIARDPAAHRDLIVYGVLLKAAYCGVTGFHWLTAGIPGMWKPFVVIDFVMGVAFLAAWRAIAAPSRPNT